MRFDLMPTVLLHDEDDVVRPARLMARRDDRVIVMVTRGVGMTHVLGMPAERVLEGPVEIRRRTVL